ncbi:MAG: LON peptidase substrate-binding domain-containing protein [Actinobacteria bacterium]|nr:LON peptidase substrate-binding domain-containing protein [Actinomycetota bacterium]
MAALVPLFPLETVLLPGLPLPLHIFEPRYRELVRDVSAEGRDRCFGVIAVLAGSEVASARTDPSVASVGTLAEIVELEPHDDGRFDLLTIGSRRFRVIAFDRARSYLQAEVEWLEERDGEGPEHVPDVVSRLCVLYVRAVAGLGRRSLADDSLPADVLRLSYQVAAHLRLPNGERQQLLEAATAHERLARCQRLLRRELALLAGTRSLPVPPRALQLDATSN